ncbi:MAG TPA: hypothetical protein VE978_02050 [Chitinophagales bacterium]|nr:hypothetical protein [Chitinophagales bacterium]
MKTQLLILTITFLALSNSEAQITFQKTYGGSSYEVLGAAQPTVDGGAILAGMSASYGGSDDIYLVKTDGDGTLQWAKIYGGNDNDFSECVQQTSDGGYIVGGDSYNPNLYTIDAYLIRMDSDGNLVWYRKFGGSGDDYIYSVKQTNDGGFIAAGSYNTGAHSVDQTR